MTTHRLKTWPEPFQAVWDGLKTYELRRDDRGFEQRDSLQLEEWDPSTGSYVGRTIVADVTHVLRAGSFPGLENGFVVLSLRVRERDDPLAERQTRPI